MQQPVDMPSRSAAPRIPLLLVIGPPGAGKSAAAREIARLLEDARIGFGYSDRDDFGLDGLLHEDPLLSLNELLHARVAAGAERLVVAWRVESGIELARFRTAIGWADITVCRLQAADATLLARIAADKPSFQSLHLQTMALQIAPRLAVQAREDILLVTDDAAPRAVAMRAYRQWAMHGAPMASDVSAA
jgi:DNA polymerase III delta prime subunit